MPNNFSFIIVIEIEGRSEILAGRGALLKWPGGNTVHISPFTCHVQVSRVDDTKRPSGPDVLSSVIANAMAKRRHLLESSSDEDDDSDSEWED